MATDNLEHPVTSMYRIRRFRDSERSQRGYRGTFEVYDEATGSQLARCDMTGRAAQSVLEIRASDGVEWTSTPDRRVLPTRWDLTVEAVLLFRFDAKMAGKMFNPLYRTSIAACDCNGVELFAVVDPRDSVPDRILGTGPGDWVLLKGNRTIARIVNLPRVSLNNRRELWPGSGALWPGPMPAWPATAMHQCCLHRRHWCSSPFIRNSRTRQ